MERVTINQLSAIGFGPDAQTMSGYAQAANERLGNFDLVIENTGANTLRFQLRTFDGTTSPSGYAAVGSAVVVVPGGTKTVSYSLVNKRAGLFGSGNTATDLSGSATSTKANVSVVIRNKADLRGGQIDICAGGHAGWGYDQGINPNVTSKNWGAPPDAPSTAAPHGGEGNN